MHELTHGLHIEELIPLLMFLIASAMLFDLRGERISRVLHRPVMIVEICILWTIAVFFDSIDKPVPD